MPQPLISVIIPTYNKGHVLAATLHALQEQTVPADQYEVLVIDDGSTDGTEALVAGLTPAHRQAYRRQENLGAGQARNDGAEMARGEILLFLDADIVMYPDSLHMHVAAHQQCDRALIVSRILPVEPNPNGLEDLIFQKAMDFGPAETRLTWKHTITQCLSVKKQHFVQIGGFDTGLRRCQDIDFGYRAEQLGFEVRYLAQARAWHNHSLSLVQRCEVERRNQRGFAALFRKHPHLIDQFPHLIDKRPIAWGVDGWGLIARKLTRRALATRPARVIMHQTWKGLYRIHAPNWLLEPVYWKVVASYQYLGYREGVRTLAT